MSDAELRNPEFLRDVRSYAHGLGITCDGWAPFLIDAYRDYPGTIVDAAGREVELDTGVFDGPTMRYWFRDFAIAPCATVTPRLRSEAKERVRTMATILRAIDPDGAKLWGVRAANDEVIPAIRQAPARVSGCPYTNPNRVRTLIRYGGKRKA